MGLKGTQPCDGGSLIQHPVTFGSHQSRSQKWIGKFGCLKNLQPPRGLSGILHGNFAWGKLDWIWMSSLSLSHSNVFWEPESHNGKLLRPWVIEARPIPMSIPNVFEDQKVQFDVKFMTKNVFEKKRDADPKCRLRRWLQTSGFTDLLKWLVIFTSHVWISSKANLQKHGASSWRSSGRAFSSVS